MPEERLTVSVTALNRYVRSLLDGDLRLRDLRLRGEISNFVHHRTGHCYFSLKDEACSVRAVMFRADAQQLRFLPQNGMQVVADCRVSLFERDGSFQVYVSSLFPDGLGSIRLAFEQLKSRLEKEGLFDPAHKKPLPPMPAVIGVVTSATGAALQDIRNVLSRRFPLTRLLLAPVSVQGAQAAQEVAAAIARLDADGRADVIIVARGGGSAEDLWVFNDERIARAAYACRTPLISAIGHEIDFTILDFVADRRAPTPSAAAELAVPETGALLRHNAELADSLQRLMRQRLQRCRQNVQVLADHPALRASAQRVPTCRDRLSALNAALCRQAQSSLAQRADRLAACARLAASLDPYAVLARGYAVVYQDGVPARPTRLKAGDAVQIETAAARLDCTVEHVMPKRPHRAKRAAQPSKAADADAAPQPETEKEKP